jgi:hypothetical protein
MVLITNRHNVDAAMKDQKYVGYQPCGLTLEGHFGNNYLICELAHPEISIGCPTNPSEDVAAIDLTTAKFHVDKSADMSVCFLHSELLANENVLETIQVCDMVAFPGYPKYYDRDGERPIMRMGTIASDPSSNYRDGQMSPARRIAYEAFSSGGSSGSPVFALAKGWKAGDGLTGGYFRDLALIGVNAGHLIGTDEHLPAYHSGISYCYKSTCIFEAIQAALGS